MHDADGVKDQWTYMVKLHLQDATGEIDAGLFERDADNFFEVTICHMCTALCPQC